MPMNTSPSCTIIGPIFGARGRNRADHRSVASALRARARPTLSTIGKTRTALASSQARVGTTSAPEVRMPHELNR